MGGFDAFHNYVIELNVDTSSLVKQGMPLNAWCDNYTFHPINAFGAAAAEQVNSMTNFRALIAGAATIFGPQFLETCKGVMDDKTHFLDTCKAVLESKIRFYEACELMMENKTRFLEACEEVMANKTWYFDPYEAMSEIKRWFLEACEKFLEIKTWISVVCQFVTGNKKTSFGLMVSVITVGVMLANAQRRGGRNVLESGDTDDHDNDIDLLDGKTEAGDDAKNNDNKDSKQFSGAMCRVTMDESGAQNAPKAPPPWAWGHIAPGRKNMRLTPRGQVLYKVNVKNKVNWFRADQVKFEDEKTFHGHDLRKRIRVKVQA